MSNCRRTKLAISGLLPLLMASAEVVAYEVELEGFASIVAGQVVKDSDKSIFVSNPGEVMGYNDDLSFTPDSLFAIQLFSDLQGGLTATAQIVATGKADWQPDLVWGFLTYQLTDTISIKAGRSRAPFFLFSDSIDVGYSYPWINPPADLYILAGIDNTDGINIEFRHQLDEWTSKLNLVTGNSFTTLRIAGRDTDIESKQVKDITWSLNRDWFTLQLTLAKTEATVDAYNELIDAFELLQIPLEEDALDLLTLTNDEARFSGIGVYIDEHPWLWISEYTKITIENAPMQNDRSAWYTTFGYRWQKFTYHLTYSEAKSPVAEATRALVNERIMSRLATLPSDNAQVAELISTTELAYLTDEELIAIGVGVRYEFHPAAAFKTEFQHRHNKVSEAQPNLMLMGIDLVF